MAQTVNATVDNNTVTFTVTPEDDHGNPTPDVIAVTNDDTSSTVASYALSADTHTYVATLNHVEGAVNLSFSDPSASGVAAADFQLVVGPGATSQLQASATVA